MHAGRTPAGTARGALTALMLLLLLAGCSSTVGQADGADPGLLHSQLTTTGTSVSLGATPPPTTTPPVPTVTAVNLSPASDITGSSPTGPTGTTCATVGARAFAAVVPLLPAGTSHVPEDPGFCSGGRPLAVTFPATGDLAWTVTVTVTIGSTGDCDKVAAGADMQCMPVPGHPGVFGTSAMCSAILCEQAWVHNRGYSVVVGATSQGRGVGPGSGAPGSIGAMEIGVDALEAITG